MASKITDSGTPFSLATASTTSNSSLLISLLRRVRPVGRRLVGGFVVRPARMRTGLAGLAPGKPQRGPVGHQPRLVDIVGGHRQRRTVDLENDLLLAHGHDPAGEPPATVLRQAQDNLGGFTCETAEMIEREQWPVDPGRGHLERVIAADRVL